MSWGDNYKYLCFHCLDYIWTFSCCSVSLPIGFHSAISTPTFFLFAVVFVASGVNARSEFCGTTVFSSAGYSTGGESGSLSTVRLVVDRSVDCHLVNYHNSYNDPLWWFKPADCNIVSGTGHVVMVWVIFWIYASCRFFGVFDICSNSSEYICCDSLWYYRNSQCRYTDKS